MDVGTLGQSSRSGHAVTERIIGDSVGSETGAASHCTLIPLYVCRIAPRGQTYEYATPAAAETGPGGDVEAGKGSLTPSRPTVDGDDDSLLLFG
jgi:hypothetical protein